jgi:hypothetical protein
LRDGVLSLLASDGFPIYIKKNDQIISSYNKGCHPFESESWCNLKWLGQHYHPFDTISTGSANIIILLMQSHKVGSRNRASFVHHTAWLWCGLQRNSIIRTNASYGMASHGFESSCKLVARDSINRTNAWYLPCRGTCNYEMINTSKALQHAYQVTFEVCIACFVVACSLLPCYHLL